MFFYTAKEKPYHNRAFLRRLPAPLFLKETVNRRLSPALAA
jgi:hypothetical protein